MDGTISLFDPETSLPTDEAVRRSFHLATLGMTGGFGGVTVRAGEAVLGAAPTRTLGSGWQTVTEFMSPRAAACQEQITGRAANQSYVLNGTKFDGFNGRELLEAKGPGYAWAIRDGEFSGIYRGANSLLSQARNQITAANGTPIVWHVAEPETAETIRTLFSSLGISGITVVNTPMAGRIL